MTFYIISSDSIVIPYQDKTVQTPLVAAVFVPAPVVTILSYLSLLSCAFIARGGGGGLEANGYSAPMRTGKTERNYTEGLKMRSGSLDRRKGSGDGKKSGLTNRVNSHETISRINGNEYVNYFSTILA